MMEGAWYNDAAAPKYKYLYNGKELNEEFSLNFYDYGARWFDPGMASWWEVDPASEGNRRWSPFAYGNNNPVRFIDPDGRESSAFGGFTSSDEIAERHAAATDAFVKSDVATTDKGSDPIDDEQADSNATTSENKKNGGEATVYIETDGVGHVYIEVNGTVFSYGRYNGSYSPGSGRFGPVGEGVLLKKVGSAATEFIKERTSKFPTKSYKVDVNTAKTYSYLNGIYSSGRTTKLSSGASGKVVNTYALVGSNCSTLVCNGLDAGGANITTFETPATLNKYLKTIEDVKKGYNPGAWGPKQ